jgi:ectoine hydroxylase-related dioxygenase (phytanoyl-CoA dioxygenase family)
MARMIYRDNPTFHRLAFEAGLAELAAQATGSEQIRIYFDQIFVKDPGVDEVFHWHQDHPFWPIGGTQVCSTWVALTQSGVESSALEFVRGSHDWGITYRPHFGGPTEIEQLNRIWPDFGDYVASFPDEVEAFEDHPDRFEIVGFDVEPGDAILFDYRMVHRSRGNAGSQRRVAVSFRWLGDDARWEPAPGTDPVIGPDDTTLRPGDLITDDEAFPVAARRRVPAHPARSGSSRWALPGDVGEPVEIAVEADDLASVLDRQGSKVGIIGEVAGGTDGQ